MKTTYNLALVLVIIGALNWGLVGFLDFDLVAAILGEGSALSRIVYALVGLSGLVVAARAFSPDGAGSPATQH